jgi:hypothetical protein
MRHLVYNVRYSVLPINSSLLTTLRSAVKTTLVYSDTKYSVPFPTSQPSSTTYIYIYIERERERERDRERERVTESVVQ